MKEIYKYTLIFSLLVSLIVSIIISIIGLNHNPQGEFYSYNKEINWISILGLFFSWFLLFFIITGLLSTFAMMIYKKIKK